MRERIGHWLGALGPGLVTGASDDDPSGIATYAQTGALFGPAQLWLCLFSFPLMTVTQEMCARIGIVTGRGLASVLARHYPRPVLLGAVALLGVANIINIGADLAAMASAMQLVVGLPLVLWLVLGAVVTVALEVLVPYRAYARVLKYLTLSLLVYVVTVFLVGQDWGDLLRHTFVPTLRTDQDYLMNIVAFLGTTISPYLFFWQTSQEVEDREAVGATREPAASDAPAGATNGNAAPATPPDAAANDVALRQMRADTTLGMALSNAIAWFIIVTTASTLAPRGITEIASATQAAEALRPVAGDWASLIFALGIIGAGLLAVPVLAGSIAYAVTETFGWREGLGQTPRQAPAFYATIALATLAGLLFNAVGIDPFQALYLTAVLNGLAAPPLLFLILRVCNDRSVLGREVNPPLANAVGWTTCLLMTVAAIALLVSLAPAALDWLRGRGS